MQNKRKLKKSLRLSIVNEVMRVFDEHSHDFPVKTFTMVASKPGKVIGANKHIVFDKMAAVYYEGGYSYFNKVFNLIRKSNR
jgi:hypothetical protein